MSICSDTFCSQIRIPLVESPQKNPEIILNQMLASKSYLGDFQPGKQVSLNGSCGILADWRWRKEVGMPLVLEN